METMEEDAFKILKDVLTDTELTCIPVSISRKLEVYFNDKFEEFVTAKAVFQANRKNTDLRTNNLSKELESYKSELKICQEKLDFAEKFSCELQSQLNESKVETHRLQNSISRLEKENNELRRAKEAVFDDNETLRSQLDRRDSELERLRAELASLGTQLQAAVTAKCQALAEIEEVKGQEMTLDFKEKRLERERNLMVQQMANLEEELEKRTLDLQNTRSEASNRALLTDARLSQVEEELRIANDTITQLRETNTILQGRCDELAQKLEDQRNSELTMHASYREEVVAQTRLAELYKGISEESNAKAEECAAAVRELQDLVKETTDQYGILETKYNDLQEKYSEETSAKQFNVDELTKELNNANDLLKNMKQDKLDHAIEQLAPTAAVASKILKKGMSLTQIYTQLVETTNELTMEKEENEKLRTQMDIILQEIEEKAPILQQQQEEYEAAVANIETLNSRLEEMLVENHRLQEQADEAKQMSNYHKRENQRLKSEISDLARQVCFLLKEVQECQTDSVVPMNNSSVMESEHDLASSQIISKKMVTFKDIEELQENNQKLLSIVRTLSTRQEEMEKATEEINSGEMKEKLDRYIEQLAEMQAAQDRQAKMVEGLLKQRDMYKNMYQQSLSKNLTPHKELAGIQENENNMDIEELPQKDKNEVVDKDLQRKLNDAEVRLNDISKEFNLYKQEKTIHEKMLTEELEKARKDFEGSSTRACRLKTQLDSANERFHLLQANVNSYKKQIKALEEKNSSCNITIAKHEQTIMILKDEAMNAQSRASRAEIQLQNMRQERDLLRDSESRLLKEREVLHRERHTQSTLKADVEAIKASLERAQAENQLRNEQRLDDSIRECAALRRRLQEEQDRFRELSAHLERQVTVAQERLEEEKQLTERLQSELNASRNNEQENSKRIEELNSKLRQATSHTRSSIPGSDDITNKKLKELENQLSNTQAEIKSLTEQLKSSRSQSEQYCNIAESAESQLREMTEQFNRQREELESKQKAAQDEILSLQNKVKLLNDQLILQGQQPSEIELRQKLGEAERKLEELDEVKGELELMKSDLKAAVEARNEAEDKYTKEMYMHSADLQKLSKLKEETNSFTEQIRNMIQERDCALEALKIEKTASQEREKLLYEQIEECQRRVVDLDAQNTLLHNQIQELSDQATIFHSNQGKPSGQEDLDTSLEMMNRSLTEEDSKSAEQLLKVMKYLRREKDLAVAKYDVLRAENTRLKSQLEILEKRLEETKNLLNTEREKTEIDVVTAAKHAELLRKVETLNAITDSNRALREERDSLSTKVSKMTIKLHTLSEEVVPLREKSKDLESKVELLTQENSAVKAEAAKWRQRANTLVDRVNKASPDDWRRLQTERENLSKLLTSERETHAKFQDEFNILKTEKTKLDDQVAQLNRQIHSQDEQISKISEDIKKLNHDLDDSINDSNAKAKEVISLKNELNEKETILNDVRNKELQIRRIAKKYKTQYEELSKSMEVDKSKSEEQSGTNTSRNETTNQLTQEKENQLREEGRQELLNTNLQLNTQIEELNLQLVEKTKDLENVNKESAAKEEKAKQVLKSARAKIMQLNDQKRSCEREINELKARLDNPTNDSDLSAEYEARIAAMRSQLEGRISRLEHEKSELQTEKETLIQRCSQLQRQMGVGSAIATIEPPTANIKPMSARTETPLASIRPMSVVQSRTAAVLPTTASAPVLVAPQVQQQQVVHTTETSSPTSSHTDYQPASTSSSSQTSGNLRQLAVQPQLSDSAESTQKEDSENVETLSIQQQPCQQQQQTVALVSPRIEQQQQALPSDQQQSVASSSTQSVSTSQGSSGHKRPRPSDSTASGSCGNDNVEHGRQEQVSSPKTKRSRQQEVAPSTAASATEIEYQVPTSSQRDQDEEGEDGCVVVDCDEGRGNQPQEEEEFDNDQYEEIEEEEELQYGVEVDNNEVEIIMEEDSTSVEASRQVQPAIPTNQQQSEAISSAGPSGEPAFTSRSSRNVTPMSRQQQQQHLLLPQQGYEDGGDDCIVPSTPTLFVSRRNDGFGEAVSSPQVPQGRFTFGEQSASASGSSSVSHISPPGAVSRSMFGSSSAGIAQVVQEGMDDTRMDLTQLENDVSGRSVPTTPLQASPALELVAPISSGPEESLANERNEVSNDVDEATMPSTQTSTEEQKDEPAESNTDSEMACSQPEGTSSDVDKRETDGILESAGEDDPIETGPEVSEENVSEATDEAKEESREAEASPSSNTRQRVAAAAAAAAGDSSTAVSPTRGGTARRSTRTNFRAARAGRPTPIVWDGNNTQSQPRGGQTQRGHPGRGAGVDGSRARGTRGRRMRAKYPYTNY